MGLFIEHGHLAIQLRVGDVGEDEAGDELVADLREDAIFSFDFFDHFNIPEVVGF